MLNLDLKYKREHLLFPNSSPTDTTLSYCMLGNFLWVNYGGCHFKYFGCDSITLISHSSISTTQRIWNMEYSKSLMFSLVFCVFIINGKCKINAELMEVYVQEIKTNVWRSRKRGSSREYTWKGLLFKKINMKILFKLSHDTKNTVDTTFPWDFIITCVAFLVSKDKIDSNYPKFIIGWSWW